MSLEEQVTALMHQVTAMQAKIAELESQSVLQAAHINSLKTIITSSLQQVITNINDSTPMAQQTHQKLQNQPSRPSPPNTSNPPPLEITIGDGWKGISTPVNSAHPQRSQSNSNPSHPFPETRASPDCVPTRRLSAPHNGTPIKHRRAASDGKGMAAGGEDDSISLFPDGDTCAMLRIPAQVESRKSTNVRESSRERNNRRRSECLREHKNRLRERSASRTRLSTHNKPPGADRHFGEARRGSQERSTSRNRRGNDGGGRGRGWNWSQNEDRRRTQNRSRSPIRNQSTYESRRQSRNSRGADYSNGGNYDKDDGGNGWLPTTPTRKAEKRRTSRIVNGIDSGWGDEPATVAQGGHMDFSGWDVPKTNQHRGGGQARNSAGYFGSFPGEKECSASDKWQVFEGDEPYDGDARNIPVMPGSVAHLTNPDTAPSSYDKVVAWRGKVSDSMASNRRESESKKRPLFSIKSEEERPITDSNVCDMDIGSSVVGAGCVPRRCRASSGAESICGHPKRAGSGGEIDKDNGCEDNVDDDDDEDGDPFMMLRSKECRSKSLFADLTDASGAALTAERLMEAWTVCAWVPLGGLSDAYKKLYGTRLWRSSTAQRVRRAVRSLPGVSERTTKDGRGGESTLLLRDKGHLKQAQAVTRVFVKSPVAEPVLHFYLVTSVLQPLSSGQAGMIERLWVDEFRRSPVGLTTVKRKNGYGQTKWATIESLWGSAIEWLSELTKQASLLGCAHMIKRLSNWGNEGSSIYDNPHNALGLAEDVESDLVFGLTRDELIKVLKLVPVLLSGVLSYGEILALEDELKQSF
ncbi:hypothetical protein GGI07_002525 [Coemansia sp. Benny D115]|nr:hypothetical protein GGI07_002525 [Coemansia sp. Benny D115]